MLAIVCKVVVAKHLRQINFGLRGPSPQSSHAFGHSDVRSVTRTRRRRSLAAGDHRFMSASGASFVPFHSATRSDSIGT